MITTLHGSFSGGLLLACCLSFAACETARVGAAEASAAEATAVDAALFAVPGFEVAIEDGRLWVTKPGQQRSDKAVTLPGAGPDGRTVRAVDRETALEYLASRSGFDVRIEDGRLWITRDGQQRSDKHVTKVGAGPLRTTIKAVDRETLDAYLEALGRDR